MKKELFFQQYWREDMGGLRVIKHCEGMMAWAGVVAV